ncbi:TPA: CaiF/GrlA family transcriptional regulator [Escherichia coli]|nr:CaiF/GrlA family transcriptional regulator [Escherichia coli]HAX4856527.1 CaiF/GrlA family transcriptional regulator [Escherichia coli]HAX4916589.1 CaiF/GrlA family transcriptional regulator [Escherichia coli]HAX4925499.1 CaiF/GrlA family transcriptional regulator [Escherichia coli]HAX5171946.1 CaiF/GrlA family transcriptional regulator [Escherichia coli]
MINANIPDVVRDLVKLPLYLIVATWGLRTQQKLTSLVVSRTFFISQQRARDILHYIYNEGSAHIRSEKLILFDEQKRKVSAIFVHEISPEAYNKPIYVRSDNSSPSVPPSRAITQVNESNMRKLRRWMCTRKAGARPPEAYLT